MPHVKRWSPPWTITDGRAGNVRQAVALATALKLGVHRPLVLLPRAPWKWLAPRWLPGMAGGYGEAFASLTAQPPELAVGCGRQAAGALRELRRRGSKVVQMLTAAERPLRASTSTCRKRRARWTPKQRNKAGQAVNKPSQSMRSARSP
mgnify:CR=1 FL=1